MSAMSYAPLVMDTRGPGLVQRSAVTADPAGGGLRARQSPICRSSATCRTGCSWSTGCPCDQSWRYKEFSYWSDLAKLLERGGFDGIFDAEVLDTSDVAGGFTEAAIRRGTQAPRSSSSRQRPQRSSTSASSRTRPTSASLPGGC